MSTKPDQAHFRNGTGKVEGLAVLVHGIQIFVPDIRRTTFSFEADYLRSYQVVRETGVLESNGLEEWVMRQVSNKLTHLAGIRIALFLRLQRCAVLKTDKHLPNFILVGPFEDHDV